MSLPLCLIVGFYHPSRAALFGDPFGETRPERDGAQEKTRTSTALRQLAPEASASTNSATWARLRGLVEIASDGTAPPPKNTARNLTAGRLSRRERPSLTVGLSLVKHRNAGRRQRVIRQATRQGPTGPGFRRGRRHSTMHRQSTGPFGVAIFPGNE